MHGDNLTSKASQHEETPYTREADYPRRYRDDRFQRGSGPRTHRLEARAIARLIAKTGVASGPWLDVPCGAGRFCRDLPQPVVGVDREAGMLRAAPQQDVAFLCASALALPFEDDSFRGALCHRLLHHVPSSRERVAILRELRRVTDGPVILSFFHSMSLQHARRVVSRRLGRRRSGRCAISLRRMLADLEEAGLRATAFHPLAPFISEQWLVLAERDSQVS